MAPPIRSKDGQGSTCHSRKAAKRALYPWINNCIIASAETGNPDELITTIKAHAGQMNLVNLATALHRLARHALGKRLQLWPLLTELTVLTRCALERSQAGAGPPHPQALANIVWSFAQFGYVDAELLATAADIAARNVTSFKPFELATLLWGLAHMGSTDAMVWENSRELFKACLETLILLPETFPFRCLVLIAWAYATAGFYEVALFKAFAPWICAKARSGTCRELANTVWSYCTVGVCEEWFLAEVTRRALHLEELSSEDLKGMLRGLAHSGFLPLPFLQRACAAAATMDLEVQRLAKALLCVAQPLDEVPVECEGNVKLESTKTRTGHGRKVSKVLEDRSVLTKSEYAMNGCKPFTAKDRPKASIEGEHVMDDCKPFIAKECSNDPVKHEHVTDDCKPFIATDPEPKVATRGAEMDFLTSCPAKREAMQEDSIVTNSLCSGLPSSIPTRAGRYRRVAVKNTFLVVSDDDEGDVNGSATSLPPRLSFLPADLPEDVLVAYRLAYRQVRTGVLS